MTTSYTTISKFTKSQKQKPGVTTNTKGNSMTQDIRDLPYKIAVLCYPYDKDDRLLLLKRNKAPNANQYSPIGVKLEAVVG